MFLVAVSSLFLVKYIAAACPPMKNLCWTAKWRCHCVFVDVRQGRLYFKLYPVFAYCGMGKLWWLHFVVNCNEPCEIEATAFIILQRQCSAEYIEGEPLISAGSTASDLKPYIWRPQDFYYATILPYWLNNVYSVCGNNISLSEIIQSNIVFMVI